ICINSAVSIPTCTTRAIAAKMQKISSQVCIATPSTPLRDGTPCYTPKKSLGLRFAKICFAPGFHRRRDGILLSNRHFLAPLDQFIGAFPQLAGFFLCEILAFICLL